MEWTPPAPERLARRLLAYEAGADQTSEELAAAAERTYDRLRARLTVFLGPHGFDSLWARAMLLAGRQLHEGGIEGGLHSIRHRTNCRRPCVSALRPRYIPW